MAVDLGKELSDLTTRYERLQWDYHMLEDEVFRLRSQLESVLGEYRDDVRREIARQLVVNQN